HTALSDGVVGPDPRLGAWRDTRGGPAAGKGLGAARRTRVGRRAGSMLPIGAATSSKGAMLALIVELLVTAVIGARFGFEASSFFVDEGNRPGIGQAFIVIDPGFLAGQDNYLDRIELLVAEMLRDDGVRLPGARREALLHKARTDGIEVPDTLLAAWRDTPGLPAAGQG
ncbi:MAG: Ldh family oxidoreductase, partial [Rubrivivax sp.]